MLFAYGPPFPERREDDEFRAFWASYPRKTGKLAAQKAYHKARTLASAQAILDGVERYKQTKPAYADWCMPTTFLNQGRWLDEPDTPQPARVEWVCGHTPPCHDKSWCCLYRDTADAIRAAKGEAV